MLLTIEDLKLEEMKKDFKKDSWEENTIKRIIESGKKGNLEKMVDYMIDEEIFNDCQLFVEHFESIIYILSDYNKVKNSTTKRILMSEVMNNLHELNRMFYNNHAVQEVKDELNIILI